VRLWSHQKHLSIITWHENQQILGFTNLLRIEMVPCICIENNLVLKFCKIIHQMWKGNHPWSINQRDKASSTILDIVCPLPSPAIYEHGSLLLIKIQIRFTRTIHFLHQYFGVPSFVSYFQDHVKCDWIIIHSSILSQTSKKHQTHIL